MRFVLQLVGQSLRIALPYLAASMGGVWSERAGVVNVALEGTILVGALGAVVGTLATGSTFVGLLCALVAGLILQAIHAAAVLVGRANAIVSGIALNLLAAGACRFILRALYDSSSNSPSIAALRGIDVIVVVCVVASIVALAKTPFGLRVRAVGEHPEALASVGVSIVRTRLVAVAHAGLLAGLAGAWLAFDEHQFTASMSGGRGFIALAAVVVSGWRPGRAALFCLLFGAAEASQIVLQDRLHVAHQLVEMLPYVATLVALAGLVGKTRTPAALGK